MSSSFTPHALSPLANELLIKSVGFCCRQLLYSAVHFQQHIYALFSFSGNLLFEIPNTCNISSQWRQWQQSRNNSFYNGRVLFNLSLLGLLSFKDMVGGSCNDTMTNNVIKCNLIKLSLFLPPTCTVIFFFFCCPEHGIWFLEPIAIQQHSYKICMLDAHGPSHDGSWMLRDNAFPFSHPACISIVVCE